jgi:hypothetical protein
MKVRNCLSFAVGTQVSGEELYQFFYHTTNVDHNKWKQMLFFRWKNYENNWLKRDGLYEVVDISDRYEGRCKTNIWFKRIKQ